MTASAPRGAPLLGLSRRTVTVWMLTYLTALFGVVMAAGITYLLLTDAVPDIPGMRAGIAGFAVFWLWAMGWLLEQRPLR